MKKMSLQNKSNEIRKVVNMLRLELGGAFTIVDYWEEDREAIGIALSTNHQILGNRSEGVL